MKITKDIQELYDKVVPEELKEMIEINRIKQLKKIREYYKKNKEKLKKYQKKYYKKNKCI